MGLHTKLTVINAKMLMLAELSYLLIPVAILSYLLFSISIFSFLVAICQRDPLKSSKKKIAKASVS